MAMSDVLPSVSTGADQYVSAYRWMLLARRMEEKITSLYHAGKIVGGVYLGRDCLERARQHLLDHGLATVAELEQWDREAVHDVQLAVATAQKDPVPEAAGEDWRALSSF